MEEDMNKNTNVGQNWSKEDIILETELISQNLELTYSPTGEEREKANDFMNHFLKRDDSVKVLLQVIAINKDFSKYFFNFFPQELDKQLQFTSENF